MKTINFSLTPDQRAFMLSVLYEAASTRRGLYYNNLRRRNPELAAISKQEWENTFAVYKLLRDGTVMGSHPADPGRAMCFFRMELEDWQHDLLTMTLYGNRLISKMLAESTDIGRFLAQGYRYDAEQMTAIINAFENNQ